MATFKEAQAIIGLNEGGYQTDLRDAGNFYNGILIGTNWGISAPVLASYLGRTPLKEEMQNLTHQTALSIYKSMFWERNNMDRLKNQSVATLIYDGIINHGTNGMRMLIEKSLKNLKRSMSYYQVFTLKGIKLLNSINQRKLFESIKKVREEKYRSSKKTYFVNGWLKRLERIKFYPSNSLSAIFPIVSVALIGVCLILITF